MPLKNPFIKEDNYKKAIFFFLSITLVSLAFSIRIVNSLSLIILVGLTIMHPRRKEFLQRAFTNPYFICCLLLFLMKAAGVLYSNYVNENIKQIGGKFIWIAIPFFFCANDRIPVKVMKRIMLAFTASLFVVSMACIIYATYKYSKQEELSVFFYHDLVRPFKHHAIFFSFYLFFCIVYWMEQGILLVKGGRNKAVLIVTITWFFFFIILLSSKLVIIASISYFLYYIFRAAIVQRAKRTLLFSIVLLLGIISILVTTNNPIRNRFSDAIDGSVTLFKQEKFSPATYFNGVQLRLLIWRFTYEILEERRSWLVGVSSGDAQHELDRKYEEVNVYQGDGVIDKKGYKEFNCHNVFLQTTLESGLIGLSILLSLIGIFFWQAIKKKSSFTLIFYLAILAFCFTESVLTSQYTVLLFMFFPLLSLKADKFTI